MTTYIIAISVTVFALLLFWLRMLYGQYKDNKLLESYFDSLPISKDIYTDENGFTVTTLGFKDGTSRTTKENWGIKKEDKKKDEDNYYSGKGKRDAEDYYAGDYM